VNATELIIAIFFTAGCYVTDIQETRLSGQPFKVTSYRCAPHDFRTWQRWCAVGQGFWGRVFLIQESHTAEAFYLNRFGEVMAGSNVTIQDVYLPACGA